MSQTVEPTINVEGVGQVEMIGTGPWKAVKVGGLLEIRDSEGKTANPTVHQRFSGTATKPNRNVIYAKHALTQAIVDAANSQLSKSAPAAPGAETQVDG